MVLSEKNNSLFFTDSGPLGESSIENSCGSLFVIDLSVSMLKPIIFGKLAHPCGVALSLNENILYVAESLNNRILRVVCHSSGAYHTSVFHQFTGRMGPTALAVSPQGQVYVARFDFKENSKNGLISVLNGETGVVDEDLVVNDCAELTGLFFSKVQDDILYATDSSTNSLLKIQVN